MDRTPEKCLQEEEGTHLLPTRRSDHGGLWESTPGQGFGRRPWTGVDQGIAWHVLTGSSTCPPGDNPVVHPMPMGGPGGTL